MNLYRHKHSRCRSYDRKKNLVFAQTRGEVNGTNNRLVILKMG